MNTQSTKLTDPALLLTVMLVTFAPGLCGQDATPAGVDSRHGATLNDAGYIYGRVTLEDGSTLEGRLRWGGREEAFWSEYFNGAKAGNPWAEHVSSEHLKTRQPVELFGMKLGDREQQIDIDRTVMVRFGDIARIDANGRDLRVTLKSGTIHQLDRYGADDFADGLQVWDRYNQATTFDEWRIRSVEFLPTPRLEATPSRLHGTVHTPSGEFTGFVQWHRQSGVGSDRLKGLSDQGELGLSFDTIQTIARESEDSVRVTMLNGDQVVMSGTREVGQGNRGVYVNDQRYGRVLVNWDAFQKIDFSVADSGPAYADFPPGLPLTGRVTTRDGRQLSGRLIYDLDESETVETLDAPFQGVDYTIPFGMIDSISVPGADPADPQLVRVHLLNGEVLSLEPDGDLGHRNAGLLVFAAAGQKPEYTPWRDVERIDFSRQPALVAADASEQSENP